MATRGLYSVFVWQHTAAYSHPGQINDRLPEAPSKVLYGALGISLNPCDLGFTLWRGQTVKVLFHTSVQVLRFATLHADGKQTTMHLYGSVDNN